MLCILVAAYLICFFIWFWYSFHSIYFIRSPVFIMLSFFSTRKIAILFAAKMIDLSHFFEVYGLLRLKKKYECNIADLISRFMIENDYFFPKKKFAQMHFIFLFL